MTCYFNGMPIFVGQIIYQPYYWEDLPVPSTVTRRGSGVRAPTLEQWNEDGAGSIGLYGDHFSPTQEQEVWFCTQLPHRWAEGTTLHAHLHWGPATIAAGNVVWALEYSFAPIAGNFPLTQFLTATQAAAGTVRPHQYLDLGDCTQVGNTISTMTSGRIYRDATNLADTYADKAILHEFDFHFEVDTPGSRTETVK